MTIFVAMKKLFCIIGALLWSVMALAQSPEEILNRMSDVWEEHEKDGLIMTVDTKIPVLGTMTMKNYSLGNKTRTEGKMLGVQVIIWDDGVTEWTYTEKTNKLEIKNSPVGTSSDGGDSELFNDVTDGYDISLKKETDDAWLLLCKKSKTNTDKDAPKTVEIMVAKNTYYPISLKTKMSGVSLVLRDISFDVKEEFVTFRMEDYPGVKVEDARKKQ